MLNAPLPPEQLLILVAVGSLLIGILLTWLIMRASRNALAAPLTERLNAAETEVAEQLGGRQKAEGDNQQLREALQRAGEERAALYERASRVPLLERETADLRAQLERLEDERRRQGERVASLAAELEPLRVRFAAVEKTLHETISERERLRESLAHAQTQLAAEQQKAQEKLALLLEAKDQLAEQFKVLASEILEEKTRRFTEQNQSQLGQLLEPLRERLSEFQKKIEDSYSQEARERHALREELKRLEEMNTRLGEEANNLTRALKGERKTQGLWGEMILETVLESSGLRKGHEYETQVSLTGNDGRVLPDALIRLPENRVVIVDAKVSLSAYERHVNSMDPNERARHLKEHITALRNHIDGLSAKAYQNLPELRTLDFVLLFVPIESALMLAMEHEPALFRDALKRNIVLVSPTTLLAVLRTIAHLWRQEQQNRNAQEIARQAGELYDKLVGFVDDMQKLGERLDQAHKSYDAAFNKLQSGRGNLISRAQRLHKLGVQPTKTLPEALVQSAQENDEKDDPA
ncbi:MAG: DNA recombination protein RmuC [Gammaproteobacteria bacterium]|nr:DNA recombination protein RmuC [Gammaproteobacteria bacterium]